MCYCLLEQPCGPASETGAHRTRVIFRYLLTPGRNLILGGRGNHIQSYSGSSALCFSNNNIRALSIFERVGSNLSILTSYVVHLDSIFRFERESLLLTLRGNKHIFTLTTLRELYIVVLCVYGEVVCTSG